MSNMDKKQQAQTEQQAKKPVSPTRQVRAKVETIPAFSRATSRARASVSSGSPQSRRTSSGCSRLTPTVSTQVSPAYNVYLPSASKTTDEQSEQELEASML